MAQPTALPAALPAVAALLAACSSAVATEELRLSVQRAGPGVSLSWSGDGFLESAPGVRGPWAAVPGAASPYRVDAPQGTALFRVRQAYRLTVARSGNGTGAVRSTPGGIECGSDCDEVWPAGTSVTLRAIPDAGSTFGGWSGDCTGTGDCVLTLDRPRSVSVAFAPASAANPFVNGDFEQGPSVGWEQHPGPVIFPASNLGGAAPFSGQYAAWLGMDPDGRRIAQLGQRVTLPSRSPLFLNFAAWIHSEELCDVPWYDRLTLYVNGQAVVQEDRICRGSGTDGWGRYSVDVSALAGQSVAFVFEMYSADALASVLLLDDIAIADTAWAP